MIRATEQRRINPTSPADEALSHSQAERNCSGRGLLAVRNRAYGRWQPPLGEVDLRRL